MGIKKSVSKLVTVFLLSTSIFMLMGNKSYANLGNLTFNNINVEQGISQTSIEVIFQDSKGYIWLGTNDGLNRYNGYEYKIYNYEEEQNSISHSSITDISEDDEGNLWVGTIQGINKINQSTGEIINYTQDNNGIKDDSITDIIVTKDDKILVSTYEGLSIYNKDKNIFETVLDENMGIISNTVYSIDEDEQRNIWIGTALGVNKISKDFKVLESYPINTDENSLGESEVYNIYCDDKYGVVWAGTESSGLFKIDTDTKKVTRYSHDYADKTSLPANQIGAIMRDKKGHLWIGTTSGLAYYDEETDDFEVYTNKIYDKNSLVYGDVKSLMQDKEGVIWVGTYYGISIFDTDSSIKHYKAGVDEDYLLMENMIHGVYEDEEGYLWVGSKSKGVSVLDRKKQVATYINTESTIGMRSDSINDITGYKDLIFIATDKGIIKIDKKSKTSKLYSLEDGLVSENVRDILVDDSGYLWIGTSSGLSLLNIETDEVLDVSNYISKDLYIRHIYQDSEGNYFLGLLKDGGLCFINREEKTVKYYKNEKGNKNSISSNQVRYINEDINGNIWIGTSYGLNKFNKETEQFYRYTAKDGIANNTIYAVLVDNNNNIWVSTNKGISKLNQSNGKIENFSVTDGLQANEFNGNAAYKSDSGELFFGGVNGLNAFYPEYINKINTKTKVLFDSFKVDNEEYSDINGCKLSENTNAIIIKFFTPIYSSDKKVIYEYKLEGASGEVSTTKDNYVAYNDLLPGKYTFKIRAIDTSGNVSDMNSITFTIEPPFWMTPIAIIIYILIAIILIIRYKNKMKTLDSLVKKRTKSLEAEMKKNTILLNKNIQLEKNKNSYFINLSHELRTPLNVISSTNQLIQGFIKKDSEIKKEKLNHHIDVSERNCKRLLNLINNIVDSSKLQNDMYVMNLKEVDIVYLVEETALTLADYIQSKGIELIIDPEIEEKIIICDSYEIERCITNLIGNAAKFTPEGGTITISLKDLEDRVMISVLDTGVGIDKKFHKAIFDRFGQVVDVDSEVKGGSGLGLTITNQIVKLHKGEIFVESEPGEGSKFTIILPVNLSLEE